ncbi:hypothetical protein QQZ08_002270 [Neonectria magnoliae]|uniref:Anaphase-promoting complex, subunit CDC26 n=1 Tax=Neonectria magnoliae TaxID=2732573 RepID=A0ABR1ICQ5_9HYPO
MLRRPATTLHITSEDVAAYEDRRAREALVAAQQARIAAAAEAQARAAASDAAGMDGVQASPDPEVRVRRAREERIGVTRRGR